MEWYRISQHCHTVLIRVLQLKADDLENYFYTQFYANGGVLRCGNDTTDRVGICEAYPHVFDKRM